MAKQTIKQQAWVYFDKIVADAAPVGVHSNPWVSEGDEITYLPDYATLARLLGVPLLLNAGTQSGVPALALDVWVSYELRRAGFNGDATWPRATSPRILPQPIPQLLESLPKYEREILAKRIAKGSIKGVTSASANILGKNYFKQVDVIMTGWQTGPELLISTKRMDSSYGKNAANRVEESYGDAKNLRLRHPLAALGFVFGLRSDVLEKEPQTAEWLADLLVKLGREDDAYHSTCLVMMEYDDELSPPEEDGDYEDRAISAGLIASDDTDCAEMVNIDTVETATRLQALPSVTIREDQMQGPLSPGRFLQVMVQKVLDTTPINLHVEARRRRRAHSSPKL